MDLAWLSRVLEKKSKSTVGREFCNHPYRDTHRAVAMNLHCLHIIHGLPESVPHYINGEPDCQYPNYRTLVDRDWKSIGEIQIAQADVPRLSAIPKLCEVIRFQPVDGGVQIVGSDEQSAADDAWGRERRLTMWLAGSLSETTPWMKAERITNSLAAEKNWMCWDISKSHPLIRFDFKEKTAIIVTMDHR